MLCALSGPNGPNGPNCFSALNGPNGPNGPNWLFALSGPNGPNWDLIGLQSFDNAHILWKANKGTKL